MTFTVIGPAAGFADRHCHTAEIELKGFLDETTWDADIATISAARVDNQDDPNPFTAEEIAAIKGASDGYKLTVKLTMVQNAEES